MEFLMNFGALSGRILIPLIATIFVMYLVGVLLNSMCRAYIISYVKKSIFDTNVLNGIVFIIAQIMCVIANLAVMLSKIGFIASFIFLAFYLVSLAL